MIPIIDNVLGIVKKWIPDANAQLDAAKELNKEFTKQMELQSKVIQGEQKSDTWLTRNWRPLFMCLIGTMIGVHWVMYDVIPYIVVLFDINVWTPQEVDLPSELWTTMRLGLGGYIGGRTAEKIASIIKR